MSNNPQRSILSYFTSSPDTKSDNKDESFQSSQVSISSQIDNVNLRNQSQTSISSPVQSRKRKVASKKSLQLDSSFPSQCSSLNTSFDFDKENDTSFSNLNKSLCDQTLEKSFVEDSNVNEFQHLTYEFLHPTKIRDSMHREASHKDYDSSTLYVTDQFIQQQSPAMKLWWKMKAEHFDTLLFFKVGKFYELYHMDAVHAVRELNIMFMRGKIAHCGFPEKVGAKFAHTLALKNYKIARIEQTETPEDLAERIAKKPRGFKIDKVVRREICEIITPGTVCAPVNEDLDSCNSEHYLYCLIQCEHITDKIGFASCNVNTGVLMIGLVDNCRSSLQSLFERFPAKHVLIQKDNDFYFGLNKSNCFVEYIHIDQLALSKRLCTAEKMIYLLDNCSLPEKLQSLFYIDEYLSIVPHNESDQPIIEALAFLVHYLRICKIEQNILSCRKIFIYNEEFEGIDQDHMILDGITLRSIGVTGLGDMSLEKVIDFCCTKSGKRMLRRWLLQPSCQLNLINERLDLVEAISENETDFNDLRYRMKKMPDVERCLMSIHSMSTNAKDSTHPDIRAIMSDEEIFSKAKIKLFVKVIDGLEACIDIIEKFLKNIEDTESVTIKRDIIDSLANNPLKTIAKFKESVNFETSFNEGRIQPIFGQIPAYDEVEENIRELKKDLEAYRQNQCRKFGHNKLEYVKSGRNRYQIEIPTEYCNDLPESFKITQSKRSSNRYLTEYIEQTLKTLERKEDEKDDLLKGCTRDIFALFDNHRSEWTKICTSFACLDVLQSMATWKNNLSVSCRPQLFPFAREGEQAFIEISQGLHPLICIKDPDFIPNDIKINEHNIMLITGPNMGGKSTIIRQVGLIALLAQVGMHVPAAHVRMTICDRIMSRIGSYDKPAKGQSTFHVELTETQQILNNATSNTLALIDEFGRGTSIEEAQALSKAVLNYLIDNVGCRTLFSTHFHSLLTDNALCSKVQLSYMDFIKESDSSIAFMYKLKAGSCNTSHGLAVAKMANLHIEIIEAAEKKCKEIEEELNCFSLFRRICGCKSDNELLEILAQE